MKKLEQIIGISCIPTCALTGEGIKELVEKIKDAHPSDFVFNKEERWNEIGKIIEQVQEVIHKHHTFSEKLRDASVKPITGIPILIWFCCRCSWNTVYGRKSDKLRISSFL